LVRNTPTSLGIYVDPHTDFAEWLGPEFYEQFKERTACLITMYKESKIDGFKVNGHSTLEENIADNEGAKLAFKISPDQTIASASKILLLTRGAAKLKKWSLKLLIKWDVFTALAEF
ncbi:hypothetical protein ANCCAN_21827, partial [Ancylostoma caninum]